MSDDLQTREKMLLAYEAELKRKGLDKSKEQRLEDEIARLRREKAELVQALTVIADWDKARLDIIRAICDRA